MTSTSDSNSQWSMQQQQIKESTALRNESFQSSVQSDEIRFGRTWWKTFIRHNIFAVLTVCGGILGFFVGYTLRESSFLRNYWTPRRVALIRLPGEMFFDVMRFISIPLYMSAIIAAIGSLTLKSVRFVGLKMLIFLVLSGFGASALGTLVVYLVKPGTVKDHPAHAICLLPDNGDPNSPPACTSDGHPCLPEDYGLLIYGSTYDLPHTNKSTRFCDETISLSKCFYAADLILDFARILTPFNLIEAFTSVRTTVPDFKQPNNPKDPSYSGCAAYTLAKKPKKALTDFKLTTLEDTLGENIRGLFAYFIFVGIAALSIQDSGRPVLNFVTSLSECTLRMGTWILWLTPLGLISIYSGGILEIRKTLADAETGRRDSALFGREPRYESQGVPTLISLFVSVLCALLFFTFVILPLLYFYIVKKSPLKLYRQLFPVAITAVGINSAAGCVPQTIRILEEVCELDARVVRLMIPIACVASRTGSAISCGGFLVYIAQIHGIKVDSLEKFIKLCFTPSIATTLSPYDLSYTDFSYRIEMFLALGSLALPYEYIQYVSVVRRFIRPVTCLTNIYTQCVGTAIICHLSRYRLETPGDNFELEEEQVAGVPTGSRPKEKHTPSLMAEIQAEKKTKSPISGQQKHNETVGKGKEIKVEVSGPVPVRAPAMKRHSSDDSVVTVQRSLIKKPGGKTPKSLQSSSQNQSKSDLSRSIGKSQKSIRTGRSAAPGATGSTNKVVVPSTSSVVPKGFR